MEFDELAISFLKIQRLTLSHLPSRNKGLNFFQMLGGSIHSVLVVRDMSDMSVMTEEIIFCH